MRTWLEPRAIPIPEDLAQTVEGHPLVAQTLARRGIVTPEAARAFLDPAHYTPTSAFELPNLAAAGARLEAAIRQKESIGVWGDFDVDGQTATAVLVSTLRALGADTRFHIPVRERESHGVNLPLLEQMIAAGARLILTCDTGIAAHEAIEFARRQGVDVIITDHHALPEILPPAHAVVNPRLLPAAHPLATLSGAGVAYKLAEALLQTSQPASLQPSTLLDLTALGLVADLATLTGEARYLVQRGLQTLRQAGRLGITAIMESAELNPAWLTEAHIGFVIGPRLNALGRLADANLSVELLTTTDLSRARVLAATLEGLNARRQLLTSQVFQAAQAQIQRDPALLDEPALVLAHPAWPAGVIGIVASRLVERYHRPTILLAAPPGELARGSARSIEGCDITAAIAAQSDLLASFGGHPMAAGLSIDPERLPEFRRRLGRTLRQTLDTAHITDELQIDGELTLPEISLALVEDLGRLSPFGPGNPPLALAIRSLVVKSHTAIGRGDEHLQIIVEDEQGNTRKVLWWQGAGGDLPQGRFDLACTVHASDYRGQREAQVEWVDARPLETPVSLAISTPAIELVDYRGQPHPMAVLQRLIAEQEVQIWREAEAQEKLAMMGIAGRHRLELQPGPALVIWTTPPGPQELQAALAQASPTSVYLFGIDPEGAGLEPFLKRLAGLTKYAIKATEGKTSLAALAAATAQREATVQKGLAWLAGRGHLEFTLQAAGQVVLQIGKEGNARDLKTAATQLEALLRETAAYRAYFRQAGIEQIINEPEGRAEARPTL
jgi:single-stranded-DNA-specific exonuclease